MIELALWIASALFLGYCAYWVVAVILGSVVLAFEKEEKPKTAIDLSSVDHWIWFNAGKLVHKIIHKKRPRRTAETGPGLSSYPPS